MNNNELADKKNYKDWCNKKLKDVLKKTETGVWGDKPGENDNNVKVLRATNFGENKILLEDVAERSISDSKMNKKLKKGNIIVENSGGSKDQPVGRVLYFNLCGEFFSGNFLKTLIPNKKEVNSYFLYQLLDYLYWRGDTLSLQTNTTNIRNLQFQSYLNIDLNIPPLREQQKIASVLYNLDKIIQETEEIIEKTKRGKRGLMQDLFKRGYYNHEEFKENRIGSRKYQMPSSWELLPIGKIGKVITGDTPSTKNENNFGNDYPFVTPEDLKNNKYITSIRRGLTKEGLEKVKEIPKGAVMMDCIGSDLGKVAIANRKLATNQQINSILPGDKIDSEFLYYSLQFMSDVIKSQAGSTATPIIRKSSFSNLELFIPEIEEQKKIATVLADFDKKISYEKKYNKKLKKLKKGLMQDLLTGKVRTNDKPIEIIEEVID